ncbi:basic amino acid/polyamine antiporter, APA family, partial [Candidatus Gastranaerophilus sp. (ex Termes propinquus)]
FLGIPISFNLPGIVMTVAIMAVLIKGVKESTKVAAFMVALKLGVIVLFIIAGAFYIKPENLTPFAPNGFEGIFMGAFMIFFAYIGFDAVATAAEETKNPQKNLPIGIIGSLVVCTIVYALVALVLTGAIPLSQIDTTAPMAHAMRFIGQDWIAGLISIGALTGLSSVLLVLMLAGSRILYAMSRDNFLPKSLQAVHKKHKTPYVITIMVALIAIVGSLFLNLNIAAELCILGTFTSFIIVCIAVLILRKTDPDRPRPFKVPFSPLFPMLGIITCSALMFYSLKDLTVSRVLFPLWLVIGIVFYFSYGYRRHRELEK